MASALAIVALVLYPIHAAGKSASRPYQVALDVEKAAGSAAGAVLPQTILDHAVPDGLVRDVDLSGFMLTQIAASFSDGHLANAEKLQADTSVHSLLAALKPNGHDSQEVSAHTASSHQGVHAPLFAYPTTFGFITSVILFIYSNRGWRVVIGVMGYLTALSTMKLAVKYVFVTYAFKFPKFVTILHFVSGGIVCLLINLRGRSSTGVAIAVPTWSEFCFMITPIAMAASISIATNNMALGFSTVAFTEIIGATTCLFTVAMVVLMGMDFDKWLLLPTCAVAMGCGLSTVGEVNFSALGMMLCFSSNAFRALKVALQQKLMTGETKDKFDPCTLLMWISVPSVIAMLFGSLISEGFAPYRSMAQMDSETLCGLWGAIGISCLNAVVLNIAQLYVTKDLGAVGGQLVAQAKAVLTVLGGMALFGESVTKLELVGFAEVLIGVYAFSAMEAKSKQQKELAKATEEAKKLNSCVVSGGKV
mmetsp:Transcript_85678/g.247394  ORF Transcript_85678/g.247394 Transcript_85678/m.247394 type:complete len:477 (-) Transcript_85678:172-1602(-)|eukprot:CAMPEP_0176081036 /NCGR_PEP_ID=MMETSP0120_2-20121206/40536_1 /TAXON_ID=160619 /ORGANISM="Kryptoperidinium foliaceum, Strain CCMP 1326" /LENGTH=476 /DNA_ID=CAMNT_0017414805 /DNA_START=73 /DNA_END=1503 /DNA_ORIENTATION=-